jgi:hypothetical protein
MESFRLNFIDVDSSFNNPVPDSTAIGYITVRAPKGTEEAVYFPRGSASKIHSMVGLPSVNYPHIQEALDFNDQFGLWISAPAGTDVLYPSYYGGKYLTAFGLYDFYQVADKENPNFQVLITVGNETAEYFKTGSGFTFVADAAVAWNDVAGEITITNLSKDLFESNYVGISILKPSGEELKVTFSAGNAFIGSDQVGTYIDNVASSGDSVDITLVGSASVAGFDIASGGADFAYFDANFADIQFNSIKDVTNDTYLYWTQKSQTEKVTNLQITKINYIDDAAVIAETERANFISFSTTEEVYAGQQASGGSFTGSLIPSDVDGFGASAFLEDLLPDSAFSFVEITVVKPLDANVVNKETPIVNTAMVGQRYAAQSDADDAIVLAGGWTEAGDSFYDNVSVFIEPSGEDSLKTSLAGLRGGARSLSTFITTIKAVDFAGLLTSRSTAPNTTGLAYYCNQFLRKENFSGTKFWSPLLGAVAVNLCRIIEDKQGGWAPMWLNTNGLGGTLAVSVEKQQFLFDPVGELQQLDEAGLNAIVIDPVNGVVITSQKTAQSPNSLSDWSYLGHQMAFDVFKRQVRDNVMTPQIGKPNNDTYQDVRFNQVTAILDTRLSGPNKIWDSAEVDTFNVNTDAVKQARDFRIKVRVKVDVFSEGVSLEFENVAQTTNL